MRKRKTPIGWIIGIIALVVGLFVILKKKLAKSPGKLGLLDFSNSTLNQGSDMTSQMGDHMWDGSGPAPVTAPAGAVAAVINGVTAGIKVPAGTTPGIMPTLVVPPSGQQLIKIAQEAVKQAIADGITGPALDEIKKHAQVVMANVYGGAISTSLTK